MTRSEKDNGFSPLIVAYDAAGGSGDGGDGGGDAHPFDALPEDVRTNPNVAKFREGGLEALARGHINAATMLGDRNPDKFIEKPADMAADGAFKSVTSKLGVLPETVDKYEIKTPDGVPKHLSMDSDLGKAVRQVAFERGIPPSEVQALYDTFSKAVGAAEADVAARIKKQDDDWAAEVDANWGDKKTANLAAVEHAIETVFKNEKNPEASAEVRQMINESGLGVNPTFLAGMLKWAELAHEGDGQGRDTPGAGGGLMTPDEARGKGRALLEQANKEGVTMAEAKRLNAEAQKYFEIATKKPS